MSNDHISVEHLNNFDAILPDSSVGTADVSPPLKSQNQTKQLQSSASEWSKEGSLSEDKSCQDSSLAQCSQGEIGQDESLNQNNIKKILNNGQDKNLQFCMSSNSLNFDGQIKAEDEQVGQLQRSSSHQVKSGSLLSSQKNSSNNVAENLSTTSNSSMLATMSKQKTIKNWSSSKALMGGGQTVKNNSSTNSYHKNASIIGKLCQERQSESNSNSKKEDENEDNDANKSEDNSLNENSQKPQRKMIFIKKSMVKVANTQSTELQKMDFQDDDLVDHDEQAYLELSKSYNIEKSISLSIHSLIVTQNDEQNSETQSSPSTIPVLVSLKTEEQNYSSDCNIPSPKFQNLPSLEQDQENYFQESYESGWPIREREADSECSPGGENYQMNLQEFKIQAQLIEDEQNKLKQNFIEDTQSPSSISSQMKQIKLKIKQQNETEEQLEIEKKQISNEINEEQTINNESQDRQEYAVTKQPTIKQYNHKSMPNIFNQSPNKLLQKNSLIDRISSKQKRRESGRQFQPVRFPIDLICVIDTSGSMNGEPLDLVKETLLFLVDLLQKGDRMCLIQFSTNAKRLTPLLSVEKGENLKKIKTEINQLVAKGSTNMTQGMQIAFEVMKQRRMKNAISSVFLLSDGLSDGAENKIKDVLKSLNFYQNYNENNFSIQTFGFGKDHDPTLMDRISQLMDGNFYYIGDIYTIDECFIDALGGLFSVVSQNVKIQVKVPEHMKKYLKIVKTFGDIWSKTEEGYEYDININQLLSGVSKDFVLEIEIDQNILEYIKTKKVKESGLVEVKEEEENILSSQIIEDSNQLPNKQEESQLVFHALPFSASSKDLEQNGIDINSLINCLLEVQVAVKNLTLPNLNLSNNENPIIIRQRLNLLSQASSQSDKIVNLHYLRVKSAEGLEKCQMLAAQKKFDEGNDFVQKLLNELRSQPQPTRNQLAKLILDLQEAQETLKKKVSESTGWHKMISCKRMHMEQRSTGTDLTYQNSIQKSMVQRRKSIKDQGIQSFNIEAIQKISELTQIDQPKLDKADLTPSNSSSSSSSKSSSREPSSKQKS